MNLKRGILIGLALYFSVFILGVIVTLFARVALSSPDQMPTAYWLITIISTVLLTCLSSLWYFAKAKRNVKEGLKLGVTFVIVGFVLDLLFFIPLFIAGPGAEMLISYYTTPSFYITLLLVVASAVFVGSRDQTHNKNEEDKQVKKKRR